MISLATAQKTETTTVTTDAKEGVKGHDGTIGTDVNSISEWRGYGDDDWFADVERY